MVENSLLKNSQSGVKRKAFKGNSLLHIRPQQNRVVERKNRTVVGLIRSMLKDKSLPLELWGEAINTCVYVLNRSSTKNLQGKTLIRCNLNMIKHDY